MFARNLEIRRRWVFQEYITFLMFTSNSSSATVLQHGCASYADQVTKKGLHERCLWIIYNNKQSTFQELLHNDKSVFIRNRNLQSSETEMFTITKDLVPDTSSSVFNTRYKPNYNLLHVSHFDVPLVNSFSKELKVSQLWKPKFEI